MSKKIAAGANKLVLEVTCGSGAFMKDQKDAETLSKVMSKIGELAGIETICVITNMEQPIGKSVGNSLEVEEAIKALQGTMEKDVKEIVLCITSQIMKLAGKGDDLEKNKQKALENIENGKAYKKFIQLIKQQNGDVEYLSNIEKAKYIIPVEAEQDGFVTKLDAETIGKVALELGARKKKERRYNRSYLWNSTRKKNWRQSAKRRNNSIYTLKQRRTNTRSKNKSKRSK